MLIAVQHLSPSNNFLREGSRGPLRVAIAGHPLIGCAVLLCDSSLRVTGKKLLPGGMA